MAGLSLVNVKKIYPASNDQKKAKKAKKQEAASDEKKAQLQVTSEGVVAVQDFNLEVSDKEFIVLVGPSGCGKSTTLRMIAGLEDITSGELWIGDRLMNDVEPKDRDIAMVFQNYALYPHMTVYENMAFSLKLKKLPKDEIDKKVREAAEILDITQYLDRKPKALSGGQRQRVAIGRAIVREPKVLLMDEPLSNLDAKLRNQMRAELIKLRQRINTTFIYVTHDQTEAMTLGDRIVIMKDDVIQQIGTPQDIYNEPKNAFVADFIGESNILDGVMLDDYLVKFFGRKFQCVDKGFEKNEPVDVVIRPEDIDIVPPEQGHLCGTVTSVTFKGVHYDTIVDFKGFKWLIQTTDYCPVDAYIGIRLNPEDIHIMHKSEYSGLYGDYSSYSAEYDEIADASEEEDDEE